MPAPTTSSPSPSRWPSSRPGCTRWCAARGVEHPRLACGPLVYDGARRQFTLVGEALALSPRELAVLRVLVQRSGEPLSKQQILERVFSDDEEVHPEAVEVLVYRLRKRLDGRGVRIVTLRGLGYVLEAD